MTKFLCTVIALVIILFGHSPHLAAEPKTSGLEIVSENAGKPADNFGLGESDDSQRQVAQARDKSSSKNWKYTVTPYLWIPNSVEGTSTVGGAPPAELDFDLSDALDLFEFGAAVRVEAWKGRFGLILDANYVDLGAEISTPGPDLDVDIKQTIIDLLLGYEVARIPTGAGGAKPRDVSIRLMGGLRYNYLKQEIEVGGGPTFGGSESWVEPVVGAQVTLYLSERWTATVRGDIGGFGVGDASDLTWNALAGFDYRAWESTSIKFGYRIYDIEYESGSGADTLGLDAQMMGPWLGVTWHFN